MHEAICALRTDKTTSRASAPDADGELSGSEVAETAYAFSGRDLRLVVRPQREAAGEQLSFDDSGGWRCFACVTSAPACIPGVEIDHHHCLRGGAASSSAFPLGCSTTHTALYPMSLLSTATASLQTRG